MQCDAGWVRLIMDAPSSRMVPSESVTSAARWSDAGASVIAVFSGARTESCYRREECVAVGCAGHTPAATATQPWKPFGYEALSVLGWLNSKKNADTPAGGRLVPRRDESWVPAGGVGDDCPTRLPQLRRNHGEPLKRPHTGVARFYAAFR